jgi:hypothetical protein
MICDKNGIELRVNDFVEFIDTFKNTTVGQINRFRQDEYGGRMYAIIYYSFDYYDIIVVEALRKLTDDEALIWRLGQ